MSATINDAIYALTVFQDKIIEKVVELNDEISSHFDNGEVVIPTKTSQLDNDSKFISISAIPSSFTLQGNTFNVANSLVQLDESGKIPSFLYDTAAITATISYDNITNKPIIPSKVSDLENDLGFLTVETESIYLADKPMIAFKSDLFSKSYNDLTDKPLIPTKVSELTNDSNFVNSKTFAINKIDFNDGALYLCWKHH